jgi:hypothetical protein
MKIFEENGIKEENLTQNQNETEPKKALSKEHNKQESNSDYPDPELLRRLLEGTSYDRRKKIELKQETKKETAPKQATIIHPQIRNEVEELPDNMKHEQGIPYLPAKNMPLKRKKFINKEREKRLGYIVYEVLGDKRIKN